MFVAPRDGQVPIRRLLGFLDEAVQQHHAAFLVDVEQHAGNPAMCQIGSHLIQAITHRPANRHSHGPADLYSSDVLSNSFPVLGRQTLEPIPKWFSARFGAEEDGRNPLFGWLTWFLAHLDTSVPYTVHKGTAPPAPRPSPKRVSNPRPKSGAPCCWAFPITPGRRAHTQ